MKYLKTIFILGIATTFMACGNIQNNTQQESDEKEYISDGTLINGKFSVAKGKQVYFSQGNLQYQASTNTWRFAENQYDMIGDENKNISESYDGWIDLFGWGTSGWNSKAKSYQPYSINELYNNYYPGGSQKNSLNGKYANADWGVFNAISNGGDKAGMWRTLTHNEWYYLINQREDAELKRGLACVNHVNGLVILPDSFSFPIEKSNYERFSKEEWKKMEGNGAIFLPAAGNRQGTDIHKVDGIGYYWSTTQANKEAAHYMYIIYKAFPLPSGVFFGEESRYRGHSVRLVRNCSK